MFARVNIRENRLNDYKYDPTYTTSSNRDYCRDASIGMQTESKIVLQPIYGSMFSDLKNYQRTRTCFVPYKKHNFAPPYSYNVPDHICNLYSIKTEPVPLTHFKPIDAIGADRAKFVIKYAEQIFKMENSSHYYENFDKEEERKGQNEEEDLKKVKCRATQTDYRESEAQTDPYSPPYNINYANQNLRILALSKLSWGNGLPAGFDDILSIERALAHRLFLMEIENMNVEQKGKLDLRIQFLQKLEAQQWKEREKELHNLKAQKMIVIEKLLEGMREKFALSNSDRLEKLFEIKGNENKKTLEKIKNNYLRELRKLNAKYCTNKNTQKKEEEKYNADDNSSCSQQIYDLKEDYENLMNLSQNEQFVKNVLTFDAEGFNKKIKNLKQPSKQIRLENKLRDIFHAFRNETLRRGQVKNAAMMKRMMMNTLKNLKTPTEEEHPEIDDNSEEAIITLQRVIRGRIVQEMMRDEIKNNLNTLLQLKKLHKSDPNGLRDNLKESKRVKSIYQQRDELQAKDDEVIELTDQMEGEILGKMLDFLDKEMIRLLDERKIHSLIVLAERDRRMREACEAGRRQKEEEARRTNDELFRQIVGIHQQSVDMYLEDIYLEAIERTADENGREHVQNLAKNLNETAHLLNEYGSDKEKKEEVADFTKNFLMQEINRIYVREREVQVQKRYTKVSDNITNAVINSQGIVQEIFDFLPNITELNIEKGSSVVEASEIFVESSIEKAVEKVSPPELNERVDNSKLARIDMELELDRNLIKTAKESNIEIEEELKEFPALALLQEKGFINEKINKNEPDEFYDEFEEMEELPKLEEINLKEQMGELSLKINLHTEIDEDITSSFDSASQFVEQTVKDVTICLAPSDNDEYSDKELSDDDSYKDDEDFY